MGFGGTPTTPRIELDDSGANLAMRRAVKGDLFASGPLVASPAFEGYGAITYACHPLPVASRFLPVTFLA